MIDSVKMTLLRRSGTRKIFASRASIAVLPVGVLVAARGRATVPERGCDQLVWAAGRLDRGSGGLGETVGSDPGGTTDRAAGQDLDEVALPGEAMGDEERGV